MDVASSPLELLRMLEPVVRPGSPGSSSREPVPPIEARNFEALLKDVRVDDAPVDKNENVEQGHTDLLALLGGVDRVANSGLRGLIAGEQNGSVERDAENGKADHVE